MGNYCNNKQNQMRGCKSEVHKKMHQTNKEKSEDNRYGIGKNHWKTVLSTVSDDP